MKKNKFLFISNWVSLIYISYALIILVSLFNGNDFGWVTIVKVVIAALLIPSAFLVTIGMILGWNAYNHNRRWLTLISTILYLIGAIIVFNVGILLIPNLVLNSIAFVQQTNQYKKDKASEAQVLL